MTILTTKTLLLNPLIQLKTPLPLKIRPKIASISARLDNSQQQLNLSVLRFTLGIPGLDESYLPRWIGYGFGSLLILNHLLGSDSVTAAQLVICLLYFITVLTFHYNFFNLCFWCRERRL